MNQLKHSVPLGVVPPSNQAAPRKKCVAHLTQSVPGCAIQALTQLRSAPFAPLFGQGRGYRNLSHGNEGHEAWLVVSWL